jgi:hypothetical protein
VRFLKHAGSHIVQFKCGGLDRSDRKSGAMCGGPRVATADGTSAARSAGTVRGQHPALPARSARTVIDLPDVIISLKLSGDAGPSKLTNGALLRSVSVRAYVIPRIGRKHRRIDSDAAPM